jgi:hypothetical protein
MWPAPDSDQELNMHPAFSVIFLTTLIGVGQGLFLALVTGQSYAAVGFIEPGIRPLLCGSAA